MLEDADIARGDVLYNDFYRKGGWKYSLIREWLWHRRHFARRFRLKRNMSILEVACGNGFHTNLLNRMGFQCVGVDRSQAGIEWARTHFPRSSYHCCDMFSPLPFQRHSFDAVYARGCSHYHYDLSASQSLDATRHLFGYLKPGGVFIMAIATDLSGRKNDGKIWHNTLDDYRAHFSSFGKRWTVDWHKGMAICGLWNTSLAAEISPPYAAGDLIPV